MTQPLLIKNRHHLVQVIKAAHDHENLNHLDVRNVTNMNDLFSHSTFRGNISQWDVSNVTDMDSMFLESQFNGDLSLWNTGKVQTMSKMFAKSRFDGDLSHWNVSAVVDMTGMFWKSEFEGEISNWNTSKVTTMNYMFQNSVFRGDISKWPLDSLEEYLRVFSQWHASALGIASYIDSRETVLGAPPAAFDELLRVTEQLGLERLDAAKHLYQMLYLEQPTLSTPSWNNFLLED